MRGLVQAVMFGAAAIGVGIGVGVGWAYYRIQSTYDPRVLLHGPKEQAAPQSDDQLLPKLVIEKTEHNFGMIDMNTTMRHAFVFRNEGQGVLKLTAGTTTCRCTLLDLRQTEVPAGGSTEVVVEWNTKNQAGPYRQTATLHTNDPMRPEVRLAIVGEVRPTLKVTPLELIFRNIRAGEAVSGEAKIFSYVSENLQITSHQWENGSQDTKNNLFEVSITTIPKEQLEIAQSGEVSTGETHPKPMSGVLIQVRSKPLVSQGSFSQKLVLKTNMEQIPQVEIPVEVTVGSDVSLFGPGWNETTGILSFGWIQKGQDAERKLTITCRGPLSKEVRYQIVSVEPKFLQVELGSRTILGDGQASLTPLVVRIPPRTEQVNYLGGQLHPLGRILISTTHPQVPQLEIKVRFAVEP